MSDILLHHNDCLHFCPLDVAKGLCRKKDKMVLIDAESCEYYQELPKCKVCANYAATDNQMGICKAEKDEPWAYGEMIAVTCEMFVPA